MRDHDVKAGDAVAHNVSCANCGYNLHSLSLNSQCPECGLPIAQSRNPLGNASAIASAFQLLALGYLIFPFLGFIAKSLLQLVAAHRLRRHSGFEHRPSTALAVRWLWAASIIEGVATSTTTTLVLFVQDPWARSVSSYAGLVGMAAMGIAFVSASRSAAISAKWLRHEPILRGIQILNGFAVPMWIIATVFLIAASAPSRVEWRGLSCVMGPLGLLAALTLFDLARALRREASSVQTRADCDEVLSNAHELIDS